MTSDGQANILIVLLLITSLITPDMRDTMAKPNFAFQKRQKELEKKKKTEEKLQRKQEKKISVTEEVLDESETEGAVVDA